MELTINELLRLYPELISSKLVLKNGDSTAVESDLETEMNKKKNHGECIVKNIYADNYVTDDGEPYPVIVIVVDKNITRRETRSRQFAILRSDGFYYCGGLELTNYSTKESDAQLYSLYDSASARCKTMQRREPEYKFKVVTLEIKAVPHEKMK